MSISFLDLFNASISASWLVLVVIGLRFLLKKAPKAIHCTLWALVAIRLLCPISIESPVSLVPSTETVSREYLTESSVHTSQQTVLDIVENPIYPEDVNVFIEAPVSRISVWDIEWSVIWLIGVALMGAYVLISWLRLRNKVAVSIPIAKDIRLCDHIESPFILGVFRPLIFLPSDMEQGTLDHVLAHEYAHLSRKDHWWKPLGFLLLTIHWFNPLMWLAYILLCRDIELACDEKVIKNSGTEQKKAYSSALLCCSVSRPMIAACPLAFGEVGVKERVKNVLNYKKPAFWFVVLAVIICIVVAVCFLTDPMSVTVNDIVESGDYTILAQCDEYITLTMTIGDVHPDTFSAEGHTYGEKEVIVYESDTTAIWLRSIKYASEGDHLLDFEFDISYDLPKVGTVVLPYRISEENSYQIHWRIAPTPGYEDMTSDSLYRCYLRGTGSDNRFTISADTAYIRNFPGNFVTIGVCMNQLTYAKAGMEPELNRGVYSSVVMQDKSFQQSGNEIYEIGWDSVQREVFLDPYGAFQQFTQDYAAAIKHIELSNNLTPLTPLSYHEYLRLGWQTTSPDAQLTADCAAVSDFLDIYDNSMIPANEYESAHNGTYQAGDLLAQHAILSSGFGRGDRIFHLFEYSLSVYDLMGGEVFTSNHIIINHPTRDEVFASMQYKMVVWNETGTQMTEVTKDFIPDDANIELWQFYTDGLSQYPEYTLFFFDGELRWFAENYYHSYQRIWEVTTPMEEDEKVTFGTYAAQEKVYWAVHSSLFVHDMEMEVNHNSLFLRFNEGEWSEGPFSLEANWQKDCPISQQHREILAELSDIEPAFALSDLNDCKFLVIDPTHFLVEKDGELYVVAWRHSNIHLEMIDYIFRMAPEAEYVPEMETGAPIELGTATLDPDPVEDAIRRTILEANPAASHADRISTVSYAPVQQAIGCGDTGGFEVIYMNVRIATYERDGNSLRQVDAQDFEAAIHVATFVDADPEVTAYWQSHTDSPEELEENFEKFPEEVESAGSSRVKLDLECVRQAALQFGLDADALLTQLKQEKPEYFYLDPSEGLEVLWSDTPDGIRCGITDGSNHNITNDLNSLETYLVLRHYAGAEMTYLQLIAGIESEPAYYQIQPDGSAVAVVIP